MCPDEKAIHFSLIFKCRDLSLSIGKWMCRPPVPTAGGRKEQVGRRCGLQLLRATSVLFTFQGQVQGCVSLRRVSGR